MNKIVKYLIRYAIILAILFGVYYVTLPALNLHSTGFWMFLAFSLFLLLSPFLFSRPKANGFGAFIEGLVNKKIGQRKKEKKREEGDIVVGGGNRRRLLFIPILLPIAVVVLGNIFSSTLFNARRYAAVIDVKEAVFREDMPETENVTNIALMDSDSAAIVGSRTLGSLSDVVSQYEISGSYNQINYLRTPKKVANLEYAGFFKWLGNRASGIPGYVMVDPVSNTAEYKELTTPMRYVESGYFGDDLMRKLRFSFPTKILGTPRYEIDETGNPVFIVPCMAPRVSMFGAMDVSEVIVFDPVTGKGTLYGLENTPAWIDVVYDGNLATEKYNWKGLLSGGFFNSIIGNRDCKQTTDDFGYIVLGDDVWYFTGVTSVNSDRSNIGFIITNARTGEYKYYPVIGAEEHSAMGAAEGEVQEKGYAASFPALINVKGEATYIMVLKDDGGLVKLYALVNVEKYSIVATGTTQEAAMKAYKNLLVEEGILDGDIPHQPDVTNETLKGKIDAIYIAGADGEETVYLRVKTIGEEGAPERVVLIKQRLADNEAILLLSEGNTATFTLVPTDKTDIYTLQAFE